jgi:hypothetical protein
MNTQTLKKALVLIAVLLLACFLSQQAMASTATQRIGLEGFDKIHVLAPYKLKVVQGGDFLVEVTVDEKHANIIKVTKHNATLFLSVESGQYQFSTLEAYVTLPALQSIEIVGTSMAELSGFNQHKLNIDIVGAGRVSGTNLWIDELDLSVVGIGGVDFGNAGPLRYAHVALDGVNESTLNMNTGSTISGMLIGIIKLKYWGTDVYLDVHKIGLSRIKWLGESSVNPSTLGIEAGHSGSWYYHEQSGHGFSIEVGRRPNGSPLVIVYWYVYDDLGNPIFLVGNGVPDGNVLEVQFETPVGMRFGEFNPASVVREDGGKGRFEFSDQSNALFSYTPSAFSTSAWGHSPVDSLPLQKLFGIDLN